ncbi:MAG: ABC transporter permease [Treponemataceae bacterium]|nr:ABC transporter permease [Treponemataceae bacterium]
MKNLYNSLAFTNIRNNRQFYLPYFLTSAISVMMFYCIIAMRLNGGLENIRGGKFAQLFLSWGTVIIGLFVVILIFYTNSFIMKRRKKELGMYNILGMEKRHVAKVLFIETLAAFVISVAAGTVSGIVFTKLLTMLLYRITGLAETIPLYVSGKGFIVTLILFGGIFLVNLLFNLMQIRLAKPVELLHSTNAGEKEPRTKWFLTLIGLATLGAGYWLSFSTYNPVDAMNYFFPAVILVIIGTYALFTAGSIALLKILRKNKNFYYRTRNFTSISGLLYRMKQNAVGLGNICILSTMVLVVISTTVCMYAGIQETLNATNPHEIIVELDYDHVPDSAELDAISRKMLHVAHEADKTARCAAESVSYGIITVEQDNVLYAGSSCTGFVDFKQTISTNFITRDQFMSQRQIDIPELAADQVIIESSFGWTPETLHYQDMIFSVADTLSNLTQKKGGGFDSLISGMIRGSLTVVVADNSVLESVYADTVTWCSGKSSSPLLHIKYSLGIDTDGTQDEKLAAFRMVTDASAGIDCLEAEVSSRTDNSFDIYMMYGGIFYLGLFLGVMFLMITVLIMYYKQISEGYEDRERFDIMEKVGMTAEEAKASIAAQVRMVFFLPLGTAALHLFAAYPMLEKILNLLNFFNNSTFIWCLSATVAVFALIYYGVFKLTSRQYYRIAGRRFQ